MMFTQTDNRTANEALYLKIQEVYDKYFHPDTEHKCHLEYGNVENYGFIDVERRQYHKVREYSADEFVLWTSIMAPHLTLQKPYKSKFFEGIRDAILSFGNKITLHDTIVLYLARKP